MVNTESVKGADVSELIIAQIQQLMAEGLLKPGEKLPSVGKLAREYSVSRNAIRHTITLMEQRHMVKTSWAFGTIICDIFKQNLVDPLQDIVKNSLGLTLDAVEVRYILEVEVTMLAAQRRSVKDLMKIENAHNHLLEMFELNDIEAQACADVQFHVAIAEASHNTIFVHIMRSMTELTKHDIIKDINQILRRSGGKQLINREHKAIYQAVLAGDVAAAEQACRAHLIRPGLDWQPYKAAIKSTY